MSRPRRRRRKAEPPPPITNAEELAAAVAQTPHVRMTELLKDDAGEVAELKLTVLREGEPILVLETDRPVIIESIVAVLKPEQQQGESE